MECKIFAVYSGFFVLRRLCQKGGIARFERDTIRRTDCLWKFAERESGLSQEELGQIIGKSSNAISRYENAENTMDVHTFAKTVNALKISPYELLLELEEPERNPEVVSLIFELGRLEHKKQKVVLETMKAMINSLSSME